MSSTQTAVPLPSGTVDPPSDSGPNLAWLAAPAVLCALLLSLSCCLVVCMVVRRLNYKNIRIRPQVTNPQFFNTNFNTGVDDPELPSNGVVDTRVENHVEVELGHPFHRQNGTCKKNDQISDKDGHHCDKADQAKASVGETVTRQLKMLESLEDSASSEEDHGGYTQCTKSPPLHAQDSSSLVDSGLHSQDCGDGTEQERRLHAWSVGYGANSKQSTLSQDGPEGGNSEWTYDVVQDMAALSQYASQGDHDVFVFREESRMPVRLPPLPPIGEYHIGRGHGFSGSCHTHQFSNGV